MSEALPPRGRLDRLPREWIDRLTQPFARFLRIEAAAGVALLLAAAVAIALSNSPAAHLFDAFWETRAGIHFGPLEYARSLRIWINDALMTLFFLLVALELKRELVLGELHNPRMAALSIAAALGGMIAPAALYLFLQWGQPGQHGWGTVMSTDTAFVIGCLALLGTRIPHSLRVFMLSLAIVDDIGAIVVVAVGYSGQIEWGMLALAALGIATVRIMSTTGFRGFPGYFAMGALIWLAVDASGIHATITGVILGLMAPARRWVSAARLYSILEQVVAHADHDEGSGNTRDRKTLLTAEVAARESLSPVERLEIGLHPWVGFVVMPLFALANAGLPLALDRIANPVTVAVFLAFAIGKPLGIVTFSWLALRSGLAVRPPDLRWGLIAGAGMLAGIGFTMALFIANLAFGPDGIESAKLGILVASLFCAAAGMAMLRWMSGRREQA